MTVFDFASQHPYLVTFWIFMLLCSLTYWKS
jgi:hypothetical protein